MAAQALSSVADNALLIAAIALIADLQGPEWMAPMMKWWFALAYVALAAFVGAFADTLPKGRVMFITNAVKMAGCALMFACQAFGFVQPIPVGSGVRGLHPGGRRGRPPIRRPSTES